MKDKRLMTPELKAKLEVTPLYETEGVGLGDKIILARYYVEGDPNVWQWFVIEGQKDSENEYLFFGLVDGFEKEFGYFTLLELKRASILMAFQKDCAIRLDSDIGGTKIGELYPEYEMRAE